MPQAMPAFDTLRFSARLKAAGTSDAQAEAHANALADTLEVHMQRLVTQDDLRQATDRLDGRMHQIATELRGEMQQLATELRSEMQQLATGLRGEMQQLATKLRGEMHQLATELRGEMKHLGAELRGELGAMRWILATLTAATLTLVVKSFA